MNSKLKIFWLLVGDIIVLYASLFIALALRYGGGFYEQFVDVHAEPFTILFAAWLIVFYIAGLYDLRRLRNDIEFLKTLSIVLSVNAILAILLFYLVPAFGIAPKRNLLILIAIVAIVEFLWRRGFNNLAGTGDAPNRAILIGTTASPKRKNRPSRENPQFGYEIVAHIDETAARERGRNALRRSSKELGATCVIVPRANSNAKASSPQPSMHYSAKGLVTGPAKFLRTRHAQSAAHRARRNMVPGKYRKRKPVLRPVKARMGIRCAIVSRSSFAVRNLNAMHRYDNIARTVPSIRKPASARTAASLPSINSAACARTPSGRRAMGIEGRPARDRLREIPTRITPRRIAPAVEHHPRRAVVRRPAPRTPGNCRQARRPDPLLYRTITRKTRRDRLGADQPPRRPRPRGRQTKTAI